ncbi:MAG: YkgJ family cysteine cluster protein [Polyangia bacterium]
MALPALDSIWIACADALDLPVVRGGDSYVHFDGARLHISTDDTLDHDDSLAQLVLHEICHLLVQGPAQRNVADWGLDNTGADPFDDEREKAAVRLQAHLAGGHGLRRFLHPTTVVRPFFESLPDDALSGDEPSAQMARDAATRAGHSPYERALGTALRGTAVTLGVALHASGGAVRDDLRCGDCAWLDEASSRGTASPDGRSEGEGNCVAADAPIPVGVTTIGCTRHTPTLDCQSCGGCCRSGYDLVPCDTDDVVIKRHPQLVVAQNGTYELRREPQFGEDRCAALQGRERFACGIYEDRPDTCSSLPAGGDGCLVARRRVGLSLS